MKMKTCKTCGGGYNYLLTGYKGNCDECYEAARKAHDIAKISAHTLRIKKEKERRITEKKEAEILASFILTTETAHNLPVTDRLGIITAESVLGMNVFKDIMADIRGIAGGRSKTLQKGLRDAREICLTELKRDAIKLGADAVVGIDLDYQDIGTTGKMLMVVASGTAVKLQLA